MLDMQELMKMGKKIEKFYAEDKYTDIDGIVWLGVEAHERWFREDGEGDALTNQQMMKKMVNEVGGYEQERRDAAVRLEARYEYNIRVLPPYSKDSMILYTTWCTKKDLTDLWAGQTRPANMTVVRRLKAGPIQEVDM